MTETWQKTHIPVMRNSLNLLLNWSHNSRQPHRISPNLGKGLREVEKSKIIHLVKSTVPSPMQPGLRAAKVADMGSIWGSPCCDLFICMVIVLCIDGDCFAVDLSQVSFLWEVHALDVCFCQGSPGVVDVFRDNPLQVCAPRQQSKTLWCEIDSFVVSVFVDYLLNW